MAAETVEDFRKHAMQCYRVAVAALSGGIAINDDPTPYCYGDDSQRELVELLARVLIVIERGEIEVNPRHAAWRKAQDAKNDPAVRALLRRASRKTPIRGK